MASSFEGFAATRRGVLGAFGGAAALALLPRQAKAEPQITAIDALAPGEFVWHPERAPSGAVAVVVSIPDQRVYVYRNGVRIGVSTCSTGKPGHETPTGVFTILQKDRDHRSSTYNNAPMPNMNRLTWSGIALHAGNLPGYPASHGCVRLPLQFSKLLFGITTIGTPVIIADAATYPTTVLHPGLVLSDDAASALAAAPPVKSGKAAIPSADTISSSILISSVESRIIVMDNGSIVASGAARIRDPDRPLGNHVYILGTVGENDRDLTWRTIGYYDSTARGLELTPADTLDRIRGDATVTSAIASRMAPGLVMMTIDLPLSADSRTGQDFVIMTDRTS